MSAKNPTNSGRGVFLVEAPDPEMRVQLVDAVFRRYGENDDLPQVIRAHDTRHALHEIKTNPPIVLLTAHAAGQPHGHWLDMVTEFRQRVPNGGLVVWTDDPNHPDVASLVTTKAENGQEDKPENEVAPSTAILVLNMPHQVKPDPPSGIPPVLLQTAAFLNALTPVSAH